MKTYTPLPPIHLFVLRLLSTMEMGCHLFDSIESDVDMFCHMRLNPKIATRVSKLHRDFMSLRRDFMSRLTSNRSFRVFLVGSTESSVHLALHMILVRHEIKASERFSSVLQRVPPGC